MRARGIKPGFFKNEDLAACGPYGMLLFAGLWTLADRAGRLEDRPPRIRCELFPYAPRTNVVRLLNALAERGFILRYSANGSKYIQIVKWEKHQNPHVKEALSTIPAPDSYQMKPERALLTPDSLTPDSSAAGLFESSPEENRRPESPPPISKVKSVPKANGNGKQDRAAMERQLKLHEWAKNALLTYPGAGVLHGSPDDVVIGKCLTIARGHPGFSEEQAMAAALVAMAKAGKSPGSSWMWFPSVMPQFLERA